MKTFALFALGLLTARTATAQPDAQHATRVVFIGNSYTYFHNLPEMLGKLAAAGGQGPVEYRMLAPGGTRLKDHWDNERERKVFEQGKWDYVVLQDQSTLGITYVVNGVSRVAGDDVFRPYAERWANAIKKAGATPVFYLTWARKKAPQDQTALNYAYVSAAREAKGIVAPVGFAWADVRRRHPEIELYYTDGSHPSAAGTYLAACVFYATLFHRSPLGLPSTITGTPVNLETEQPETGKTAALAELPPDQAKFLQTAAWDAVQAAENAGGYPAVSKRGPPELPRLPDGEPVADAGLEGTWRGTTLLTGPAEMVLRLERSGSQWRGHLEINYHQKGRPDVSVDVMDVRAEERRLTFDYPNGLNGATIHFTAAVPRRDEMVGRAEAEFTVDNTPARFQGEWGLRKR